jgi:hypothetical protein
VVMVDDFLMVILITNYMVFRSVAERKKYKHVSACINMLVRCLFCN